LKNNRKGLSTIEKLKKIGKKLFDMPIIEIFKGAAPYVICNVIVLISISLWGPLTTALPQLLGYSIF
jgi:TRAP-type mannitol/chloroaromatic compound transport system permease large subunit